MKKLTLALAAISLTLPIFAQEASLTKAELKISHVEYSEDVSFLPEYFPQQVKRQESLNKQLAENFILLEIDIDKISKLLDNEKSVKEQDYQDQVKYLRFIIQGTHASDATLKIKYDLFNEYLKEKNILLTNLKTQYGNKKAALIENAFNAPAAVEAQLKQLLDTEAQMVLTDGLDDLKRVFNFLKEKEDKKYLASYYSFVLKEIDNIKDVQGLNAFAQKYEEDVIKLKKSKKVGISDFLILHRTMTHIKSRANAVNNLDNALGSTF
ncbi:hypothetical protein Dip510_001754 [Elusimicrobium posterum]|uniref:hypothetical protein n=1 Tax=Elusimicrobium posterum TaxID=3116653 RepID=UPI003C7102A2